jgi:hypothetical protein
MYIFVATDNTTSDMTDDNLGVQRVVDVVILCLNAVCFLYLLFNGSIEDRLFHSGDAYADAVRAKEITQRVIFFMMLYLMVALAYSLIYRKSSLRALKQVNAFTCGIMLLLMIFGALLFSSGFTIVG